jgi:hypothetical protein
MTIFEKPTTLVSFPGANAGDYRVILPDGSRLRLPTARCAAGEARSAVAAAADGIAGGSVVLAWADASGPFHWMFVGRKGKGGAIAIRREKKPGRLP